LGAIVTARSYARHLARGCALAAAGALAACSGDFNPVRDAAVYTGVGPERKPAADFVAQSRPADLDYVPTGRIPPARAVPAKPAVTVKAAETAMDAVRATNEARAAAAREAGSTPPPQAPRPVVR
jgi:NADPH-dependent glutamate synthase beta subunit-like oxidoreductase